jgi:hypothetical protein
LLYRHHLAGLLAVLLPPELALRVSRKEHAATAVERGAGRGRGEHGEERNREQE